MSISIPAERHRIRDIHGILRAVDGIYAAACGEIAWQQAVADISRLGELDGCALITVDRHARHRVVLASWGPHLAGNPQLTDRVLRSAPGATWHGRIGSEARRPAASGWTHPIDRNDLVSWACVVVASDRHQVVCLEAYAGAGRAFGAPALDEVLAPLAPHLTRAWRLCHGAWSSLERSSAPLARSVAAPTPELAELPSLGQLRAEFGLTKAEARLALRLAEGSSLADAAQAFNVKMTTVRSQLAQVFAKTGVCRQSELVALLLGRGYGSSRHRAGRPSKHALAEATALCA